MEQNLKQSEKMGERFNKFIGHGLWSKIIAETLLTIIGFIGFIIWTIVKGNRSDKEFNLTTILNTEYTFKLSQIILFVLLILFIVFVINIIIYLLRKNSKVKNLPAKNQPQQPEEKPIVPTLEAQYNLEYITFKKHPTFSSFDYVANNCNQDKSLSLHYVSQDIINYFISLNLIERNYIYSMIMYKLTPKGEYFFKIYSREKLDGPLKLQF